MLDLDFTPEDVSRFKAKVAYGYPCHVWTGAKFHFGHGVFRHRGKNLKAHRVALAISGVAVPDHLNVNHTCDNPACVNIDHLYLGTQLDNIRDRVLRGRTNSKPPVMCGENNPRSKLTDSQVAEIRELLASSNMTQKTIADMYSVNHRTISAIHTGKVRQKGKVMSGA